MRDAIRWFKCNLKPPKNHDKYAVKMFEDMSLSALKAKGFVPTHIIQFNDNCASQYKGRGTFHFLSHSQILKWKMYFGARHGKGPADGAVGRVKAAATRAVKAQQLGQLRSFIHSARRN